MLILATLIVLFFVFHNPALWPPSFLLLIFFCKLWNITLLASSISTPSFLHLIFSLEIFEEEETEGYNRRIWEYKEQDTERSKSRTLWVAKKPQNIFLSELGYEFSKIKYRWLNWIIFGSIFDPIIFMIKTPFNID